MMRMNKKPFYTAPEAEFLVVGFEENFVNTGGAGQPGGDEDYNDQGDF